MILKIAGILLKSSSIFALSDLTGEIDSQIEGHKKEIRLLEFHDQWGRKGQLEIPKEVELRESLKRAGYTRVGDHYLKAEEVVVARFDTGMVDTQIPGQQREAFGFHAILSTGKAVAGECDQKHEQHLSSAMAKAAE